MWKPLTTWKQGEGSGSMKELNLKKRGPTRGSGRWRAAASNHNHVASNKRWLDVTEFSGVCILLIMGHRAEDSDDGALNSSAHGGTGLGLWPPAQLVRNR